MRPVRFILAFFVVAAYFTLAVKFRAFLHSSRLSRVLMVFAFLFAMNLCDRWFRRLGQKDELTKLNLGTTKN